MHKLITIVLLISTPMGPSAGDALTLARKAEIFETDLRERFLLGGQLAPKLLLPNENRPQPTYNMPDNTYLTGIYLGTLALKYSVTGDAKVKDQAKEVMDALNLLCTVSGKKGLLARAAVPKDMPFDDDGVWHDSVDEKYRWRGDASSDQVAGLMFGSSLAFDSLAGPIHKQKMSTNLTDLLASIIEGRMRMVGYNGSPTTWGRYDQEYVSKKQNMNALLWLQHLKVADHVTDNLTFGLLYQAMAGQLKYADFSITARKMGGGEINHSDDVLLFLAYIPLLNLEAKNKLAEKYTKSLQRTWEGEEGVPGVREEANPFFAFAAAKYLNDDSGIAAGIETLQKFPFDMKWNRDTISDYEKRFDFAFEPVSSEWKPEEGKAAAVPIDRRPKAWSAWVEDPYVAGSRTEDIEMEFNGHDYLLAYWYGRATGVLSADQ